MARFSRHHLDTFCAAAVFCAALGVYVRTLCPTLYWGDCGELAAAALTLGIPHPTGYPLWTMLAHTWTSIFPFGTSLWRLNLLSAVFGAAAAAFVYGAARALALPRPVALTVAGLFAFSATFWQQCTFAETYSLTACCAAALLFFALRWQQGGCSANALRPLALACGLALTCGQINALFLPAIVGFVLLNAPALRDWRNPITRRRWLSLFGLAALPLLTYAYLPGRARAHPAVNWGDPQTPFAFFYHVTGRPYAPLMFHTPPARVWQNGLDWAANLNSEYAWPVIAFAVVGCVVVAGRNRPAAFLLTWVGVADVAFTVNYAIYNHYIYFIPCYLVIALWFGVGLQAFWERLAQQVTPARRPALASLSAAALLALVPFQAAAHWAKADLHESRVCYHYGHDLLASVPPGGILIDNGQDTGHAAMLYLQTVEHYRPDVLVVQRQMLAGIYDFQWHRWANLWYWQALCRQSPHLATLYAPRPLTPADIWHEDILGRLIAHAVREGRPVAVLRPDNSPIGDGGSRVVPFAAFLAAHYDTAPVGLVTRLYPHGSRPANAVLLARTRAVWSAYAPRPVSADPYRLDDFLTPIALDYAQAELARARLSCAQGDYADAADCYRSVLQSFRSDEAARGLAHCARLAKAAFGSPNGG